MFELLALLAIVAVGCVVAGAIFVALMAAKFAIKLVLLPFKLLLLPVLAIIVIVKLGVLLAVGREARFHRPGRVRGDEGPAAI